MDRWTIDVCRTCRRIAQWPFCEHRPTGWVPQEAPSWCMPVTVRPAYPAQFKKDMAK